MSKHKIYKSGLQKEDISKVRYDLIPHELLTEIAEQFTYGANKYGFENWKLGQGEETKIFNQAAYRHFIKYIGGIKDGEKHGIACITNIIMSEWHNRYKN